MRVEHVRRSHGVSEYSLILTEDEMKDFHTGLEDVDDNEDEQRRYSPFDRTDPRTRAITEQDEQYLAKVPQPLTVLVPVTIRG